MSTDHDRHLRYRRLFSAFTKDEIAILAFAMELHRDNDFYSDEQERRDLLCDMAHVLYRMWNEK